MLKWEYVCLLRVYIPCTVNYGRFFIINLFLVVKKITELGSEQQIPLSSNCRLLVLSVQCKQISM